MHTTTKLLFVLSGHRVLFRIEELESGCLLPLCWKEVSREIVSLLDHVLSHQEGRAEISKVSGPSFI